MISTAEPPKSVTMSEQSVRHLLKQGYGVEDIAQKLHIHPDAVRAVVASLRARGALRRMWRRSE